ncbi:MAG: hypothetical protein P9L92_11405 [Candidatus Electryonea clarkiae]|nr:hypothetical protein [Candidatus Electryonea clarkiae]MDP8286417.1 hypothetical protein [Candidatus Electryonea clarkiae]
MSDKLEDAIENIKKAEDVAIQEIIDMGHNLANQLSSKGSEALEKGVDQITEIMNEAVALIIKTKESCEEQLKNIYEVYSTSLEKDYDQYAKQMESSNKMYQRHMEDLFNMFKKHMK